MKLALITKPTSVPAIVISNFCPLYFSASSTGSTLIKRNSEVMSIKPPNTNKG